MRNTMMALMSGSMLAAVSGLALACPPEQEGTSEVRESAWVGSFDEHLGEGRFEIGAAPFRGFSFTEADGRFQVGAAPLRGFSFTEAVEGGAGTLAPEAGGHSFKWVMRTDGQPEGEREEIVIFEENGKRKVTRNGKELSEEEAAALHEHIRAYLGDGSHDGAHVSLQLAYDDGPRTVSIAPRIQTSQPAGTAAAPPKVMVGITMAEPDESLRAHLDLGDRKVIMLDGVIEGLPAAEAGLMKYDIILAIDENDDEVTAARLHEVLMSKEPGEELVLRVLRAGERETYRVKLSAYDAKTLRISTGAAEEAVVFDEHVAARHAEHVARFREMTQRLRESGLDEGQIAQVQRQVEQAIRQSKEAVAGSRIASGGEGQYEFMVPGPDGRMFELKIPDLSNIEVPAALRERMARFGGDSADIESRLSRLEDRMEEMSAQFEERMERTLHRFEELTDRLERRLGDGG